MKFSKLLLAGSLALGMASSLYAETNSQKVELYLKERQSKPAYQYLKKSQESLDNTVTTLETPEKINAYMHSRFLYRKDREYKGRSGDGHDGSDYMQTPLETYSKQAGDCEDWANFAVYALNNHGYQATVVSVFDEDEYGHAVCVYINKNKFGVIECDKDRKATDRFNSLYEIADDLCEDWNELRINREDASQKNNFRSSRVITKEDDNFYLTNDENETFPLSPDPELNKKLQEELNSLTEDELEEAIELNFNNFNIY